MKCKKGEFEEIGSALADLGYNRLPSKFTDDISEKKQKIVTATKSRDATIDDVKKSYLPEGKALRDLATDGDAKRILGFDGYKECLEKIQEILDMEIEIDIGDPIDMNRLADVLGGEKFDKVVYTEQTSGTLKRFELIKK